MDFMITIDQKGNWVLGYDTIGEEYFIWNRLEHKWLWFKRLSSATKAFETNN